MDRTPGWNQATYQVPVENNITLEGNLSLPEHHTFLKNLAPWRRLRSWQASGLHAISRHERFHRVNRTCGNSSQTNQVERNIMIKIYRDRYEAGRELATKLTAYAHRQDVLVLALPRGGVPVGYEVAKALQAPLDVFVVRKLGVPGYEELAMGAIATGGICVINEEVVQMLHIPKHVIDAVVAKEQRELERRERLYRDDRPPPDVNGCIVILVDDGLATGST